MTEARVIENAGIQVYLTVTPDLRQFVVMEIAGTGQGIGIQFEALPALIAHLQRLQVEGPEVLEQMKQMVTMGPAPASMN